MPERHYSDAISIAQRIMNALSDPHSLAIIHPAARDGANTLLSNAGVALLAAAIEQIQPAAESLATCHLKYAASSEHRINGTGLFTGWAGMYCSATYAAHGSGRYPTLRTRLSEVLNSADFTQAGDGPIAHFREYDLISGRAGAYLAMHYDNPAPFDAQAQRIEGWFGRIFGEGDQRWRTPFSSAQNAPVNNIGISHGIAGVLAALVTEKSPRVDGLIDTVGSWIARKALISGDAVEWPCAVLDDEHFGVRYGWCYGTPGIAVALLRAAVRRNNAEWHGMALAALRWMMRGDAGSWNIRDYGLCHGWSGIALCFFAAGRLVGDSQLTAYGAEICRKVIEAHDDSLPLGYEAFWPGGRHYPSVSLLEGAPGIALLLLTATANAGADWFRIFGLM
jgi:hypothetical protein